MTIREEAWKKKYVCFRQLVLEERGKDVERVKRRGWRKEGRKERKEQGFGRNEL